MKKQKITIYWETKIEHKEVIHGTEDEINAVIENIDGDSGCEYLKDIECSIKTEQTYDTELDFYEVEDQEVDVSDIGLIGLN